MDKIENENSFFKMTGINYFTRVLFLVQILFLAADPLLAGGSMKVTISGGLNYPEEDSSVQLNGETIDTEWDEEIDRQLPLDVNHTVRIECAALGIVGSLYIGYPDCAGVLVSIDNGEPSPGGVVNDGIRYLSVSGQCLDGDPVPNIVTYNIKFVSAADNPGNDFGASDSDADSCDSCSPPSGSSSRSSPKAMSSTLSLQPLVLNPEANFTFGMGRDSNGLQIGNIRYEQLLSSGILHRESFEFTPVSTFGESISDGGGLRQVYGPEGLANIVEDPGDGSMEVRFYVSSDVGPKDGDGLYTITGQPFVVHRLIPGSDPVASNGIIHAATRDGQTKNRAYYGTGNAGGGITREVDVDGRITETTTVVTEDPNNSSNWTRVVEIRELLDHGTHEVELSVLHEEYASRPWGEVLERSVEDPSGANLVTEYTYYENQQNDGTAYKKLKYVIYPNGSWNKYTYNSQGKVSKVQRPWKDLPAHPDNASDNNCQYALKSYDFLGSEVSSEDYILGIKTGSTQTVENYDDGEYDGSQWRNFTTQEQTKFHGSTTSSGLVSSRSYLSDWSSSSEEKILYRVGFPNQTATRYLEEKGDFDESTGLFTLNSSGVFTRRTSTQGTLNDVSGIANRTSRTVVISDYKGTRHHEEQIYTGTGYETVSVSTHQYESDSGRRLLSTSRDGQAMSSTVYTSPTESTETDAYGIETTETYDASGRLISSVKIGIAAGANHEAQPAITTTYDENDLTSATTLTAGTLSLSSFRTIDLTGREVSQTDEEGRTTAYIYTNGGRIVTETGPGGVTHITTYYLDGQLKSITGTGVIPEFHDYSVDGNANIVHTVYYGTGDDTSPRWRKIVTNGLGQVLREESPGPNGPPLVVEHIYNSNGQRTKMTRTGMADTLYVYDNLGRLIRQGSDLNINGSLDVVSADPISESDQYYEKDGNDNWWEIKISRRYLSDGDDDDIAESVTKRKLGTGVNEVIEQINPDGSSTLSVTTVNRPNKTVTTTTTSSLSNLGAVQVQVNGLLVSQSSLTVNTPALFRYDALGRQTQMLDPRTGLPASTTVYDSIGQMISVTDGVGNTTTFTYYGNTHANAGLTATQTNQESETTRYAYDALGLLTHQWGNSVYPLTYSYSAYGEMTQLATFQSSGDWNNTILPVSFDSATPSLTTWTYHSGSGLLASKMDAAGEAVSYTYHNSGQLATRTWARGVSTAYAYDGAGRLTSVDYSDVTPDVTHTYRRDGQRVTSSDAAGSHAFDYHEGIGTTATQTITGGLHGGLVLNWSVDGSNRPNGYSATINANPVSVVSYAYDATSRLNAVGSGNRVAEYNYAAHSDLLQTTILKDNTVTKLTGTKSYDHASRLGSVAWVNNAAVTVSSHSYTYDGANRRVRADLAYGSYWEYVYNDKGEVLSGVKKSAGGSVYPGLNHGYTFDEIGNRLTSTIDAEGGGSRSTTYTPNNLNQYTSIDTSSAFDITGSVISSAIVKVNTQNPQRQETYFRKELPASNSGQPYWANVDIEVTLPGAGAGGGDIVTNRSGNRYIAPTPETPSYDEDGNLVSDGRWVYTWDGENRLIAMETRPAAIAVGVPKRKLEFAYDGSSRRVRKRVYDWDVGPSSWTLAIDRRFIYDQWNLVAEVDPNDSLLKTHVWGLDQSQTLQGAGGVGGLLWSTDHVENHTHFASYDGNGNVSSLINASTSTVSARYDYNPFGEIVLLEGGEIAEDNSLRFSTKYEDAETGLYYYGFRYYQPQLGRWINRDPIEEIGGPNLYGMVKNNMVGSWDYLGNKGDGHHIVPWSIFNEKVSSEVQRFFDSDAARIANEYFKSHNFGTVNGVTHYQYNKLIKEALDKHLGKTALKDMTVRQAQNFLNKITSMPPSSAIGRFNAGVADQAAQAMRKGLQAASEKAAKEAVDKAKSKGAKGLSAKVIGRKIPVIGIAVTLFTVKGDAAEHGWGPAIGNGIVDSIPFVGIGKGVGEWATGWSLLEEMSTQKQIDPQTSTCPLDSEYP